MEKDRKGKEQSEKGTALAVVVIASCASDDGNTFSVYPKSIKFIVDVAKPNRGKGKQKRPNTGTHTQSTRVEGENLFVSVKKNLFPYFG